MADRDFATPTHQLVLQKAHREGELSSASFHQPHQGRKAAITGTRLQELAERLTGEPTPLVHEDGVRHG